MPLPTATAAALRALEIRFEEDVPLAPRVYWRIGGAADGLARLATVAELTRVQRAAADHGFAVTALGRGSNVLVSDDGVRGLVVVLVGDLAGCGAETSATGGLEGGMRHVVTLGAGHSLAALVARAGREGWNGFEGFAGIPGTVGGAVCSNAGTALGDVASVLDGVDVVLPGGEERLLAAADLALSYRSCTLPPGALLARVRMRTLPGDMAERRARMRKALARRRATQPLDLPSGGSTFANPPGDAAGRLLEAAGLKGYTVGRARISEKHANFVVNLGGATAWEVRSVVEHAQAVVEERFGIRLVPEVRYAGDWARWSSGPSGAGGRG